MSVLTEAADALRELEAELAQHKLYAGGEDSLRIADKIRHVRRLLPRDEPQWIGMRKAKRLLGVRAESIVETWAQLGFLRSRTLPNGRLQVRLDDVLKEREVREGLTAFGGEDLTDEELRILKESRPGTNPWECDRTPKAQ